MRAEKTLHQQKTPVLNWRCIRLTQVDVHTGRKTVLVVAVVSQLIILSSVFDSDTMVTLISEFRWLDFRLESGM